LTHPNGGCEVKTSAVRPLGGASADGRRWMDDSRHCGDGKRASLAILEESNFIAKATGMIELYFKPAKEAVAIWDHEKGHFKPANSFG
jgi:hypothetical protein